MYLKMLQQLTKWGRADRSAASRSPLDEGLGFTIRFAYPDDDAALRQLAALDSQPLPVGPLLVAEIGGELWAAVNLTDAPEVIADPFHHTAELVSLLLERTEQLTRRRRARARLQPPLTVPSS
jgi:hypothetical protein